MLTFCALVALMFDAHKHEDSSGHLEDVLAQLGDTMQAMTLKMDEFLTRIASVTSSPTNQPPPVPHNSAFIPATNHKMKLEVPRFDGIEPFGWIFKINQYFAYHGTPDHDRLTITTFYMEGRALAWFQYMTSNAQFTSWQAFLQALQNRCAPSQYEDPTGVLFKLT